MPASVWLPSGFRPDGMRAAPRLRKGGRGAMLRAGSEGVTGAMGKAEEAFEEARRRIAEAARTGAKVLDLRIEGLERIPEEIAGLTGITSLSLTGTQVSDLGPIAGLTGMTRLWLDRTRVSDLRPIAGMTGMTTLWLDGTRVSDLGPIEGMTGLTRLYLDRTG